MSRFDDGIKRYIKAQVTLEVGFPVSWKDVPAIAWKHCPFYVRATKRCGLNQEIVNYPDNFVGHNCPLELVEDDENV